MQAFVRLFTLVTALLLATGCPDPPDKKTVSADPRLQLKYEMARRALADIRRAKQRGRNIYGDCRAVQLLAKKELRKHKDPAVQRLIDQIDKLCAEVKAY